MKPFRKPRASFRREKLDAEMAEEMQGHLQRRMENLAVGMSPGARVERATRDVLHGNSR